MSSSVCPASKRRVETRTYEYNVCIEGQGNIFRYDNQHEDFLYPGHSDPHHRHTFLWPENEEASDSPQWIGANNWPTLAEVIKRGGGVARGALQRAGRPSGDRDVISDSLIAKPHSPADVANL